MVERVTRHLSERLGEENVAAHHGSLAKELRLDAEQRLKQGKLRALVATASLELGIDIGDVELVCQLGSPRSISTFLQRVGRANHSVGGVPKGRLFPLSRDELIECTALLAAVRAGELDRLSIPEHPLDVLAQQIVAEVAAREYCRGRAVRAASGAPGRIVRSSAGSSMPSSACCRKASAPAVAVARLSASRCGESARCAPAAARVSPRSRAAVPFPTTRTTRWCSSPRARSSARSTRTSRSKASPATSSSSATPRIAFCASRPDAYASRTPRASHRPFRSGWARRRRARSSCRVRCRGLREEVEAALPEVNAQTIGAARRSHYAERHGLDRVAARQIVEYLACRQGHARASADAGHDRLRAFLRRKPAACSW